MAQGSLTARMQIIDAKGNVIGTTADLPLQVDSRELKAAIVELTEAIVILQDTLVNMGNF
jgi:sporulation protein YlmC with PRC-barrel domain